MGSPTAFDEREDPVENRSLTREIRPVIVPAEYWVWAPLASGFAALFPGFFTFVISQMFGDPFKRLNDGPDFTYGLIVFAIAFLVFMALLWVHHFKEPERTSYKIHSDRIEYDEGFWSRHRRTVVFDQVVDVELTESLLQQTRQAGTVTLITQQLVSGQDGRLSNRRIALRNVPNPRDVYDLVRSLALKKKV